MKSLHQYLWVGGVVAHTIGSLIDQTGEREWEECLRGIDECGVLELAFEE